MIFGRLIVVSRDTLLNCFDQIIVYAIYMYFTKFKLQLNLLLGVVSNLTERLQLLSVKTATSGLQADTIEHIESLSG